MSAASEGVKVRKAPVQKRARSDLISFLVGRKAGGGGGMGGGTVAGRRVKGVDARNIRFRK